MHGFNEVSSKHTAVVWRFTCACFHSASYEGNVQVDEFFRGDWEVVLIRCHTEFMPVPLDLSGRGEKKITGCATSLLCNQTLRK